MKIAIILVLSINTLVAAAPLLSIERADSFDLPRLVLGGVAGQTYTLEAAEALDLPQWKSWLSLVLPSDVFRWSDDSLRGQPMRFFRLRAGGPGSDPAFTFRLLDQNGIARDLYYHTHLDAIAVLAAGHSLKNITPLLPVLDELAKLYANKVQFWVLLSESAPVRSNVRAQSKSLKVNFPVLNDQHGLAARSAGLTRAGEVALIRPPAFEVVYRGEVMGSTGQTAGRVKVLDFGLAKLVEASERASVSPPGRSDAPRSNAPDAADSPTIIESTQPGMILGTPAYMSPEQARGQAVDKRTDIWAFGCCLYECLSGRKPFRGQTVSDLMAEVLKSEPDWSRLPAETPPAVVTLLHRCLEKEPSRRWSSMGDIALMLEESTHGATASSFPPIPTNVPLTPSLSPSAGERVSAGRVRGMFKGSIPVVGGLLALVIGAVVFYWKQSRPDRNGQAGSDVVTTNAVPAPSAASAGDPTGETNRSIAVLAFANLSDERENEYFSDGISEELLNVLAKVPGLRVTARTSSFSFKGKNVPVPEIAKELNVGYVVEGSVQRIGDRVRIRAQLINAADGFHVWSQNYDHELKDIFALQDEIARAIAARLKVTLAGPAGTSSAKRHTENVDAYESYLKGRFHSDKLTEPELNLAITHFQQALAKQPDYARAYAGLADAYGALRYFADVSPGSIMPQVRQHCAL